MKFLVRSNCEYSIVIEADDRNKAIVEAFQIDLENWGQAWSPTETEDAGTLDEPFNAEER